MACIQRRSSAVGRDKVPVWHGMSFRWPHQLSPLNQGSSLNYNNEIRLTSMSIFPAVNDVMAAASAYAGCWRSGEADRGRQRQRSRGCFSHSSDSLVSFKTRLRTPSLIYCSCRLIPTTNSYFPALARLAAVVISTSTVQSQPPDSRADSTHHALAAPVSHGMQL